MIFRPVNAFLPIFWAFVIMCFLVGLRLSYQSVYKSAIFRRFLVWFRLRFGNRLHQSAAEEEVEQLYETRQHFVCSAKTDTAV